MYQQRSFLEDEEKALQPFSEECAEIFIFFNTERHPAYYKVNHKNLVVRNSQSKLVKTQAQI
jgi:hypothetical protein